MQENQTPPPSETFKLKLANELYIDPDDRNMLEPSRGDLCASNEALFLSTLNHLDLGSSEDVGHDTIEEHLKFRFKYLIINKYAQNYLFMLIIFLFCVVTKLEEGDDFKEHLSLPLTSNE